VLLTQQPDWIKSLTIMKISHLFIKQLIIIFLSLLGVYVSWAGEFIISSALFCSAFIVSNLDFSDTLRT